MQLEGELGVGKPGGHGLNHLLHDGDGRLLPLAPFALGVCSPFPSPLGLPRSPVCGMTFFLLDILRIEPSVDGQGDETLLQQRDFDDHGQHHPIEKSGDILDKC